MSKYMTVFLGDTPLCHLVGFEDDYVLLRYVRKKQRFLAAQEILVAGAAQALFIGRREGDHSICLEAVQCLCAAVEVRCEDPCKPRSLAETACRWIWASGNLSIMMLSFDVRGGTRIAPGQNH